MLVSGPFGRKNEKLVCRDSVGNYRREIDRQGVEKDPISFPLPNGSLPSTRSSSLTLPKGHPQFDSRHGLNPPASLRSSFLHPCICLLSTTAADGARFTLLPALGDSPFHAVRSTCRQFQQIVDKLLARSDDDVDVATMCDLEYFYQRNNTPVPQYVDVLLSDPHLRECLSRKTGWNVDAIIFRLLKQHIPDFGQGVRYLKLRNLYVVSANEICAGNDIPSTLRDTFPTLLELGSMNTHVHLNSLPPALQRLVIGAQYASDAKCDCTNTLSNSPFKTTLGNLSVSRRSFPSIQRRLCTTFGFKSRAYYIGPPTLMLSPIYSPILRFCTSPKI